MDFLGADHLKEITPTVTKIRDKSESARQTHQLTPATCFAPARGSAVAAAAELGKHAPGQLVTEVTPAVRAGPQQSPLHQNVTLLFLCRQVQTPLPFNSASRSTSPSSLRAPAFTLPAPDAVRKQAQYLGAASWHPALTAWVSPAGTRRFLTSGKKTTDPATALLLK